MADTEKKSTKKSTKRLKLEARVIRLYKSGLSMRLTGKEADVPEQFVSDVLREKGLVARRARGRRSRMPCYIANMSKTKPRHARATQFSIKWYLQCDYAFSRAMVRAGWPMLPVS